MMITATHSVEVEINEITIERVCANTPLRLTTEAMYR